MFPLFQPNQQLPLDKLLDIAKFAVLATWQRTMRMHGFVLIMYDKNVFVKFCNGANSTKDLLKTLISTLRSNVETMEDPPIAVS